MSLDWPVPFNGKVTSTVLADGKRLKGVVSSESGSNLKGILSSRPVVVVAAKDIDSDFNSGMRN
jgi:hypothetical protein